ncbi:MAG: hypothetical protein ACKOPE_13825 [Novosphingobium sp.]
MVIGLINAGSQLAMPLFALAALGLLECFLTHESHADAPRSPPDLLAGDSDARG